MKYDPKYPMLFDISNSQSQSNIVLSPNLKITFMTHL